jgi:hypothetical protein
MASSTADSDHVILPPPSALNPIPSLQAALRIDNKERFLDVLLTNPSIKDESESATTTTTVATESFRQLLVFGKESLRTLLMKQVLEDPHTKTFGKQKAANNTAKSKKTHKNWDDSKTFPLPKILQTNVVGTKVLLKKNKPPRGNTNNNSNNNNNYNDLLPQRDRTSWKGLGHDMEHTKTTCTDEDIYKSPDDLFEHVDVITYLVRPWDLDQTMAVVSRIQGCALNKTGSTSGSRTHKQHHRIVYVPRMTAMCATILADHKIWDPSASAAASATNSNSTSSNCVSVTSLQLDLFPLGADLLSLEYEDGIRASGSVGGTPSGMIETASRALSKLQDVVGPIPRIQSLGHWGEDVLEKLLNETVDDYWAARREDNSEDTATDTAGHPQEDEKDDVEFENEQSQDDDRGMAMVLIDRRLDMVTPMVTPLTYEGLLDELVGIECGHVEIAETIINPPEDQEDEEESKNGNSNPFEASSSSTKNPFEDDDAANNNNDNNSKTPVTKASLGVHEGDTLYAEVRDQHVEKFGSFLQNQAIALKESHANFTSKETKKDLDEIEKFVKQIPVRFRSIRILRLILWPQYPTKSTHLFCFHPSMLLL